MPERPFLLVFAGPNGSGKTTLTRLLRDAGLDFGTYVNPDDLALTLPDTPQRDALAQDLALKQREHLLETGQNLSYETVMSHPSHLEFMARASAQGFEVHLYFVCVDSPEVNLRRVAARVRRGGHDVPPERIVARYARTLSHLHPAVRGADHSTLFDNSDPEHPLRLIATLERGTLEHVDPEVPDWVRLHLLEKL